VTAKPVEGAQRCSDPTCYLSASAEVGARAGVSCWAGQMAPQDLQLVRHLDGSCDDSNTLRSIDT